MVRMVAGRLFHMSGPATDSSGPSSGGAELAYINRVGRSKHDKVREVRRASTVESLMHDNSNFEGETVLDRQPV